MPDTVRLGQLAVDFVARNAKFLTAIRNSGRAMNRQQEAVRRLRRTYQQFNRTARQFLGRVTSIRNVVIGLAGAGGLGLLIRNSVASASAIRENAQQAGVSVRAFQELSFAANNYAVSQDALIDGLKELSLRGDEFVTTGVGPAAEAFERLGISQQDVIRGLQDTSVFFDDIIRKTQELDAAAQIRIADELFGGTGGEQFVRIIQGGADGLARLRTEAARLGLIISSDQIQQAQIMRQQIDQLSFIFQARLQTAILENADALRGIVDRVSDLAPRALQLSDVLIKGFGFVVDNAQTIIGVFAAMKAASAGLTLGRLFGPIGGVAGLAAGGAAGFLGARGLLNLIEEAAPLRELPAIDTGGFSSAAGVGRGRGIIPSQSQLNQARGEIDRFFRDLTRSREEAFTAAQMRLTGLGDTDREAFLFGAQQEAAAAVADRRLQIEQQIVSLQERIQDQPARAQELNTQLQGAQAQLRRLTELAGDEGLLGQFNEWVNATFSLNQRYDEVRAQLERMQQISFGIGSAIGGALDRLAAGTTSLKDSLTDLVNEISAVLRRTLIIEPLRQFIGQQLFGSLAAGIPARQAGGLARGLTLVGEQGPELVDFRQTARVYSAPQTQELLGRGVTLNYAPSVQGANADQLRALMYHEFAPGLVDMIEEVFRRMQADG